MTPKIVLATVVLALGALSTYAAAADENADAIMRRRDELIGTSRHWRDRYRRLWIFSSRGLKRDVEVCDVKVARDGWKTIGFITRPNSMSGTALLLEVTDWKAVSRLLYQPQYRRVRRLLPDDPHESFLDSDLSIHDLIVLSRMESWDRTDVDARLVGEEPIDGEPTYVLELTAHARDAVYRRYVLHLAKKNLVERRIELYEDQDAPRRRVEFSDVRMVGSIPVPHHIEVETPDFGTHSEIRVVEVAFDRGLSEGLFEASYLERGGCKAASGISR